MGWPGPRLGLVAPSGNPPPPRGFEVHLADRRQNFLVLGYYFKLWVLDCPFARGLTDLPYAARAYMILVDLFRTNGSGWLKVV